jgi:phosphotransferase system HPr (HPr) family protein
MVSADAVFRDRYGLHPRAANRIRETAAATSSRLTLQAADGGSAIDAGSMLSLVGASIRTGDRVRVSAEGPDEEAALTTMVALLEGGVCHP